MTDSIPDIYLASASPRRCELLNQMGIRFGLLKVNEPESRLSHESAQDYVRRISLKKARAGRQLLSTKEYRPVLGADTVVLLNGEILGKPKNREHGLWMLDRLSGCSHEVLTAISLVDEQERTRISKTTVAFRKTSLAERCAYWDNGEPHDKAGAYAIQGLGAIFIHNISGSYSGAMGLPIFETAEILHEAGINIL